MRTLGLGVEGVMDDQVQQLRRLPISLHAGGGVANNIAIFFLTAKYKVSPALLTMPLASRYSRALPRLRTRCAAPPAHVRGRARVWHNASRRLYRRAALHRLVCCAKDTALRCCWRFGDIPSSRFLPTSASSFSSATRAGVNACADATRLQVCSIATVLLRLLYASRNFSFLPAALASYSNILSADSAALFFFFFFLLRMRHTMARRAVAGEK